MGKLYYSNEYRREFLEIHSEHILWEIENESITSEDIELYFNFLIQEMEKEMGCELFQLGRSGRHVCIEKNQYRRYNKGVRLWKNKYKNLALSFIK